MAELPRKDATDCTPTRTLATTAQYLAASETLKNHYAREHFVCPQSVTAADLARWFTLQQKRWSRPTLRVYRRGVEHFIAETVDDAEERERLLALLAKLPEARVDLPRRTSAKKARVLTEDQASLLIESLKRGEDTDGRILALLCHFGPVFGLRPKEWTRARVDGEWLWVRNAKATRAGKWRCPSIVAGRCEQKARAQIHELCNLLREAVRMSGWRKVLRRLGSRLARVSRKLGLRRLCLYCLRGTAAARLKAAGLQPVAIAAVMGHASSSTAFRHYPSPRQAKGWRFRVAVSPHPRSVAAVKDTYFPDLKVKLSADAAVQSSDDAVEPADAVRLAF